MPDITSLPQLARNANRVAEIVGVLVKYGLADWIPRTDPGWVRRWVGSAAGIDPAKVVPRETRIRLTITELGTTFIKLGQMLATRRDLIGPELAAELTKLQNDVPADPFDVVKATVEAELGKPIAELFSSFEERPIASASIGQVHRATLPDGRQVVVKVQHPNIKERIESDLEIANELALLAERYISEVRYMRLASVVAEFRRVLLRELDLRRELRHLQIFMKNFANDPTVRFPSSHPGWSSSKVLTMDYLAGTPLAKISETPALLGESSDLIARRGAQIFLDMIFRDGCFHADPHPGNLLVLPDGVLGLLDFGMVGRIDQEMRTKLEECLSAVLDDDPSTVTDIVIRVGEVPPNLDRAALQVEIADQMAFYTGMPLESFHLGTALEELTELMRKYQIVLPPSIAMLLKVLIMLEGTARLLAPTFNLTEAMHPYRRRFLRARLSPKRSLRRLLLTAREWEEVLRATPGAIRDLMQVTRGRGFAVQLQHLHLEPSVNRLVLGLLTSSLFLGSSLLWAYRAPPTLSLPGSSESFSLFGLLGTLASCFLGFRLLRAIGRSGHLEDE